MTKINLSEWALTHQPMVLFLIVVLMAAGFLSYQSLGRAEDPNFTFKVMVVRTAWPGATAQEVEEQVTDRLERTLQEVPWFDVARSYSKPGESLIFLQLKDYTPPKEVPEAWYQVRKKVGDMRFSLPDGVRGPFFNDEFGDTFGTIYAFTSDGFSYAELKSRVEHIQQELLSLPNVKKIELIGVQPEKIYIEISHGKLATLGIDPLLIVATLRQQNALSPAGRIDTGDENVYLRVSGDFKSVETIREIGIRVNDRQFRLGDIANVYRGYADPPNMKMRYQGKEAIGLAVSMSQGGDIMTLGRDLDREMARLTAELPIGIDVDSVSNQPHVVKTSVDEFMKTLLEAVVIVLAVSFISLGWRTGLVVALCIPLVLAVTFLLMKLFNIDLQRISLGALIIALGLLVDDAIIAVEMMVVKMEQGWDRFRAATFAYTSTAFPMLTGTLVTAAGFLPVGFAKSSAGEYTFSIFAVVTIALLVSWVVAVIFTPYIGYKLLPEFKKSVAGHDDNVYRKGIYPMVRRIVSWCVEYRKTVILATLLLFFGAIYSFKFVQNQFFPSSSRPELVVDLRLPEGASFAASEREAKKLETILAQDVDVENFVSYIGGGSPRFYLPLDQQMPTDSFAQFVVLTKGNDARERVLTRLNTVFENDFTVLRARVNRLENGPPVGYPVQFRVVGKDPMVLRKFAERVAGVMRASEHTADVNLDWNEKTKSVQLDVDQDKARALGISSHALSDMLESILTGLSVTAFREGDQLIEVVARSEENKSVALGALKDINIYTQKGIYVPLSQIAHIRPDFEDGIIWRRNRYPTITVRADVRGDIQAPVVTAELDPLLNPIRAELPDGYRIDVGGAVEESKKGEESILAVMPWMLLAVTTLLMLQLGSFQRTVLVLLSAPLGIIGVAAFLLIFNVPFGFVANLGVIALFGMIMRNSVILVDQIEQDIAAGHSPWDATIESTVRRFRPIMLTAAAAVLAMIPLTHSAFWGPMAIAIMGGLIVATLLTVLALPAMYAAWFRVKRPVQQGVAS